MNLVKQRIKNIDYVRTKNRKVHALHLSPCNRIGIEGVSTHSFRRSALTLLSDTGIPLRVIQEAPGHRTLDELQKYLEVRPEQVRGAISALSMLSHVGKPVYSDLDSNKQNPQVDPTLSPDGGSIKQRVD